MTPSTILNIYLVLLVIEIVFSIVLDRLNLKHILTHSTKVPEYLKGAISEETYKKSVQYSTTKLRFSILATFFNGLVLFILVATGFFGDIDRYVNHIGFNVYGQAIVYLLLITLIFSILSLPFSLYSTFVIEERFGFNTMTFRLWIIDRLKSMVISAILLSILVSGLIWFMITAGDLWWVYGFLFIAFMQVFLIFVYPLWIAPLFNKFTELERGALKNKIEQIADLSGYKAKSIFVMDGSKRSKHANAYFTGFGTAKRIVLFDTLLQTLRDDQVVSVLAHEIAHEKLNHIKKSMALSLGLLLFGFYIIDLLLNYEPLFFAFGFDRTSYHGALVLFSFASAPVTFWLSPLFSMLSRIHEYEADAFAIKLVKTANDLKTALVELSKKSLSNFTPHPLYSFFHYSHPTLHERIKAMEAVDVT